MSIRLDPLTKSGVFDHEFYTSAFYDVHREVALKYLYAEGFNQVKGEYTIVIREQHWYVTVR